MGNDFLIRWVEDDLLLTPPEKVQALCDRRFGFGADGVIESFRGQNGRPYMHLVNSDGSSAEMSGNGLRCLIHHLVRLEVLDLYSESTVDTLAGERRVRIHGYETFDTLMSEVQMPKASAQSLNFEDVDGYVIDVGNPHLVIPCESKEQLESLNLQLLGPRYEKVLDSGVNVEWVYIESSERVHLRVWERGAGETLACGTGSVATYIAVSQGHLGVLKVEVLNPGGSLWVGNDPEGEYLWLEGPSSYIGDVYATT